MQKKMRLTGIITQGASRMGTAEYIKAFKVASSFDGNTYTTYRTEGQRKDKVRTLTLYETCLIYVSSLYLEFTIPAALMMGLLLYIHQEQNPLETHFKGLNN